jgi:hypothetical protein
MVGPVITYDVTVTREDDVWVGSVLLEAPKYGPPNLAAATQTRRLAKLADEVRDIVATTNDVDPDSFDLHMDYGQAIAANAAKLLTVAVEDRATLAYMRAAYERPMREAVLALRAEGLSLRDVAELSDVSFQRVLQIEQSAA